MKMVDDACSNLKLFQLQLSEVTIGNEIKTYIYLPSPPLIVWFLNKIQTPARPS